LMSEAVSLRVPTLAVPIEHPHFGWKKFTKENVWWHKRWALGVPVDYWVAGALALVLLNVP